jgi:thiol-disulfide isomerase/thioredoxin
MEIDWKKYVLAFVITGAIFVIAFYIASLFDTKRVADIRSTADAIAIDILSLQTQFDLVGHLDCAIIAKQPILSDELNSLASRLSVAENNLGSKNTEVITLKKQYSLLEIKDYLLMQEIAQKCKTKPVSVLYFYTNTGDCADCRRMGDVLTYLREEYPELRVYSFDYDLELTALKTLISLQEVKPQFPAMIINGHETTYGFKNLEAMQALIPELKTFATSTATTTKNK